MQKSMLNAIKYYLGTGEFAESYYSVYLPLVVVLECVQTWASEKLGDFD